jgi:hypothetical protein
LSNKNNVITGIMTLECVELAVFYTDGYQTREGGFGFKLSSPAGVFSAQLSALFMALRHIREVIQPPEKCLIITDSLSSIKAMLSRRILYLIRSYMKASNCALTL